MSASEPSAIVTPFRASTLDLSLTPDLADTFAIAAKAGRAYMSTAMLLGESGVGKTRIARHIHQSSPRSHKPFQVIDLSQATPSLFESEFFGHERGSFTGAAQLRKSPFELANGGTVFLDEIGTLSFDLQARLLRIIQDKTFKRVGGTEDIKVDVRILAATSLNLEEKVRKGEFREDLYHRLNVLQIHIPPLRSRRNDIIPLADYFLGQASIVDKLPRKHLSEDAKAALIAHDWPGNVRALENEMSRATIMTDGEVIEPSDLSFRQKANNIFSLPPTAVRAVTPTTVPVLEYKSVIQRLSELRTFPEIENICQQAKLILIATSLKDATFDKEKAASAIGCKVSTIVYRFDTLFDYKKKIHSASEMSEAINQWESENPQSIGSDLVNELITEVKRPSPVRDLFKVIDDICMEAKLIRLRESLINNAFVQARVAEELDADNSTVSFTINRSPCLKSWLLEQRAIMNAPVLKPE